MSDKSTLLDAFTNTFRGSADSSIRLPMVSILGFTGHRKLSDPAHLRHLIRDFLARYKASSATVCGVSSLAEGGDLLFAESCIEMGIPLQVLLPFSREMFRADFDSETWAHVESVLRNAIDVEVTDNGGNREECYYECGIETVQRSQTMLALWDGEPSRGLGGTGEIVQFARSMGKPVTWIHSGTGAIEFLGTNCSAMGMNDSELDFLNSLPEPACTDRSDTPIDLAECWLEKMDAAASRFAPRLRRMAAIPMVVTSAVAVLTLIPVARHAAPLWSVGCGVLGLLAAALPALIHLKRQQLDWARSRSAAEVCRSMLALWKTPGRYDVLDEETVPELGGMIRAFQYLKMEDRRTSATDLEQFKSEYRRNRFQHQIKYFLRQAARSSAVDRRLSRVIRFCVYIGIALMFARGILSLLSPPASPGKLWITVLAALLFEVATIARALIVVYDIERRQARYRELSQNLKLWEQEFSALQTWPSVLRVSARIERTLLAELLEWRSLAKHTKLPRK